MELAKALVLAVAVSVAVGTCVGCADAPGIPGCELRVHFGPETEESGEAALARINRATGCNLENTEDGVPVVLYASMVTDDGKTACGATTIARRNSDGSFARVVEIGVTEGTPNCNSLEALIMHEVIHGMLATKDLHAEDGVFHAFSGNGESLNEASLVTVCSHMVCPSFFPEL